MPFPPILRDSQGNPIPQVWDGQNWQPYRGNAAIITIHQNKAKANGNGVAGTVDGCGSATFQVTGTFSATVAFEGSVDGVKYAPLVVIDPNGARVTSTKSPGLYKADIAGLVSVRTPVSGYVSGEVTVTSRAMPGVRAVEQSVLLNGRNAQVNVATLTTTPLAAGGSYGQSAVDLLTVRDRISTGLCVYADTVTQVELQVSGDNAHWSVIFRANLRPNREVIVPRITIQGRYYRWSIRNLTATAQTILSVQETYSLEPGRPGGVETYLAYQVPIRDTATHTTLTDPNYIWISTFLGSGDSKKPLVVSNNLDQAATLNFINRIVDYEGSIHSVTVAAGQLLELTNKEVPGIDVPFEDLQVKIACAAAPTSGTITVGAMALVG